MSSGADSALMRKAAKSMKTLQRFLFRNQAADLTDKDKQRLLGAIEAFVVLFDRDSNSAVRASALRSQGNGSSSIRGNTGGDDDDNSDDDSAPTSLPLLEDAMKVSLFSPAHKKKLLKLHSELLAKSSSDARKSQRSDQHGTINGNDDDRNDEWVFEASDDEDPESTAAIEPQIPPAAPEQHVKPLMPSSSSTRRSGKRK
eukprot:jgi/Hompol1/5810/HPOL_000727-RA